MKTSKPRDADIAALLNERYRLCVKMRELDQKLDLFRCPECGTIPDRTGDCECGRLGAVGLPTTTINSVTP